MTDSVKVKEKQVPTTIMWKGFVMMMMMFADRNFKQKNK
jgi:hypothetical protein